jgi:hypothetical protein
MTTCDHLFAPSQDGGPQRCLTCGATFDDDSVHAWPYLTEADDRPLQVRLEQLRDATGVEGTLANGDFAVRAWFHRLAADALEAIESARLSNSGRDGS